jgi:hypothetical protein
VPGGDGSLKENAEYVNSKFPVKKINFVSFIPGMSHIFCFIYICNFSCFIRDKVSHCWMNMLPSDGTRGVPCFSPTWLTSDPWWAIDVDKSKISQLSCGISRRHTPFLSSSFENLRVDREQWWRFQQNGCAREEIYFLCICTTLVILMSILNACIATLLLYSGLAVLAIQCKVVFVFRLVC